MVVCRHVAFHLAAVVNGRCVSLQLQGAVIFHCNQFAFRLSVTTPWSVFAVIVNCGKVPPPLSLLGRLGPIPSGIQIASGTVMLRSPEHPPGTPLQVTPEGVMMRSPATFKLMVGHQSYLVQSDCLTAKL